MILKLRFPWNEFFTKSDIFYFTETDSYQQNKSWLLVSISKFTPSNGKNLIIKGLKTWKKTLSDFP